MLPPLGATHAQAHFLDGQLFVRHARCATYAVCCSHLVMLSLCTILTPKPQTPKPQTLSLKPLWSSPLRGFA